ncbi:hypothetical protein ACC848_43460, partial [Rhizobium johnstonii]
MSGLISSDAFKMERSYAREISARVCATNGSLAGSLLQNAVAVSLHQKAGLTTSITLVRIEPAREPFVAQNLAELSRAY